MAAGVDRVGGGGGMATISIASVVVEGGHGRPPVDTVAFPTVAVLDAADNMQSYRPGKTGSMAVANR